MNRRFVLIVDRTGSMSEPVLSNAPKGLTRWQAAQESGVAVVGKLLEYNPDGIDFYLFNEKFVKQSRATPATVADLFKKTDPYGSTDFVPALKDAIDAHFVQRDQPTTIIVVTDGQPSGNGKRTLADLLVATANRLEADGDLGISFFQIGDDQGATQFLKTLDDDLVRVGKAKYDIVDTKTADEIGEIGLTAAILAAVND